jgi:hypothetical protein
VPEPKRLFLAWQPANLDGDRFRWVVGLLEPSANDWALRYLQPGPEFAALNPQRTYEQLVALGYQGYPAFSLKRNLHQGGIVATFMRRLPPRSRPDFAEYMQQFRLKPTSVRSDVALLASTESKLPSDGFSLVDPLDPVSDTCDLMLELAGYRHYAKKLPSPLEVGDQVSIAPEPDNEHDPNAVVVRRGDSVIGYINRLQTRTFLSWLAELRVTAVIERLNGKPDRPRAFIFVRVRPGSASVAA